MTDEHTGEASPRWERLDDRLRRQVRFDSHPAAIGAIVQLAVEFEKANHHADLALSYTTLTLELTSHDTGGITDRDHDMAHRIDAVLDGLLERTDGRGE